MVRSEDFNAAVASLPKMSDQSLSMAGRAVLLGLELAERHGNKEIAIEMLAMSCETTKEMVRRMAAKGGAPGQVSKQFEEMTLQQALDKLDKDTNEAIAKLEAA